MRSEPPRLRSLTDLQQVKQALARRAEEEAAARHQQEEARKREASARELFVRAAGAVQALPDTRKARLATPPPSPIPRQRLRDQAAVLQEALSDEFDVSTLLDVDDQLSFRRPGIGSDVTRKLRKGDWSIQRELDLHGLPAHVAEALLREFLRDCRTHGVGCVRIVHGKGRNSEERLPVLKNLVDRVLRHRADVLAFHSAPAAQGGTGAVLALLEKR